MAPSALLESEVQTQEQCMSTTGNHSELEIILPVDYEIIGKCTYVFKKQDGVAPWSKYISIFLYQ